MTTRSQKRKAAEELISTEIETSLPENTPSVNPVAGTSKSPKITSDNLEEIKSSLRKEIMSDLTKILAENQKEMLKLIAPTTKKQHAIRSAEESDSDPDDIPENATSTPIRNRTTATASKTTPINSRNKGGLFGLFENPVCCKCNVRQSALQKFLKISIKNSKCAVSN